MKTPQARARALLTVVTSALSLVIIGSGLLAAVLIDRLVD